MGGKMRYKYRRKGRRTPKKEYFEDGRKKERKNERTNQINPTHPAVVISGNPALFVLLHRRDLHPEQGPGWLVLIL
ncbi:hypothetical protein GALMADRAFT_260336, partial [Galerina marginata CBS 339.88]